MGKKDILAKIFTLDWAEGFSGQTNLLDFSASIATVSGSVSTRLSSLESGTTTKTSDLPAWKQDLESTTERSGRKQDKENLMEKLRDLGYM